MKWIDIVEVYNDLELIDFLEVMEKYRLINKAELKELEEELCKIERLFFIDEDKHLYQLTDYQDQLLELINERL